MTVSAMITDAPPAAWSKEEIESLKASYPELESSMDAVSKYNPTPGTGRTGFVNVPPNNYPFYNDDEKYVPVMQADGGQLSGTPRNNLVHFCGILLMFSMNCM